MPFPPICTVGDVKQRNEGIFIKGEIKNKEITILVDTGSSVTIINPKLFEEIDPKRELNFIATNIRLKSANGNDISVLGECPLSLKLRNKLFPHTFVIAQIENSCIIGVDFMSEYACNICMKEKILRLQGLSIPYFCDRTDVVGRSRVVLLEDFRVPPNSEFIAPAMIESPNFQKGSAIIEPLDKFMEKQDV